MCLDDGVVVFLVRSSGGACSVRLVEFGRDAVAWEWVVGGRNGGGNLEYLKAGWVWGRVPQRICGIGSGGRAWRLVSGILWIGP